MESVVVHQFGTLLGFEQAGVAVLIAQPKGILDDNAAAFRTDCLAAMEKFRTPRIALSLETVEYLSSAGIGAIVSLLKRVREAEGRLVLCALAPQVGYTLRLCRLTGDDRGSNAAPLSTAANTDEAVKLLTGAAP